jgi:hypothetical protein
VTGEGAVRILCNVAKFAFDDPIVYQNQPGVSHLHQFFGNTAVNAFTTADSIANVGNGTCSGGIANRTGYWTPAMVDASGQIVPPTDWSSGAGTTIYYKVGYDDAGERHHAGADGAAHDRGRQDLVERDAESGARLVDVRRPGTGIQRDDSRLRRSRRARGDLPAVLGRRAPRFAGSQVAHELSDLFEQRAARSVPRSIQRRSRRSRSCSTGRCRRA